MFGVKPSYNILVLPMKDLPTESLQTHSNYLNDLRECVIYQSKVLEKTTLETSWDLDMSHHVFQRTLKLWKEIGDITRNQGDLGTPRQILLMNPVACNVSESLEHCHA